MMPRQTLLQVVPDAPMTGVEPDGFYQTPNSMAIKAIRAKLTSADWCLWSYLQMFDPFGDRMHQLPSPKEIGEIIGFSEKQVKRSLNRLEELDLYKYQILKLEGQNIAGALARRLCETKKERKRDKVVSNGQSCPSEDKVVPNGQSCPGKDKVVQEKTKLSRKRQSCPKSELKPLQGESSTSSQTIQTYSDFLKTLSDSARESFLDFGRKKASQLPKTPELPDKWIAANHKELYEQFLASTEGKEAKKQTINSQYDWPNDPHYDAWLEKAFYEGMQWVEADETEREQRWAFYEWAQYTQPSPFEGVYI